jgi:tetratricopeptide (TPR) repeat protein
MVRLCIAGGGLSGENIDADLAEAARFFAQGDRHSAAEIYRAILQRRQDQPDAMHMLGVIARQAGNTNIALRFFEAALRVKPDMAAAWFNRAVLLRQENYVAEALQSARMAVEIDPGMAEAWDIGAQILKEQNAYTEAAKYYAHATGLQPNNPAFLNNYAILLLAMGDRDEAFRILRQAERVAPDYPPLLLGNMFRAMGYPQQAAERFARTSTLRPDFADAATSEAMAHLQMGNLEHGWSLWEQRPDFETTLHSLPFWQGQKVTRLLLYEDQGLGDAIQFARYIPLLKTRADHVTLRIRAPLQRLFAENFTSIELIGENDMGPCFDARCRLSSLPFHFNTRLDNIPVTPYLSPSLEHHARWREQLAVVASPRIGMVWAGNAKFHNDASRSLPFNMLRPIVDCGAEHFVSLQKDQDSEKTGLFAAGPLLEDFADTAALISALDLVISVDTAVAHLAGALGKPVFILLPFDSDWRWLLGRQDSPWYSSAHLFRQTSPGDWQGVIAQVVAKIMQFLAGDTTSLRPETWHGEGLRQNPYALTFKA